MDDTVQNDPLVMAFVLEMEKMIVDQKKVFFVRDLPLAEAKLLLEEKEQKKGVSNNSKKLPKIVTWERKTY